MANKPFDFFTSPYQNVLAGVTAVVLSFTVEIQSKGAELIQFGNDELAGTFVGPVWSIQINSIPVSDYNSMELQLGSISEPSSIGPVSAKPGDRVDVVVFNNTGVALDFAARIRGFLKG